MRRPIELRQDASIPEGSALLLSWPTEEEALSWDCVTLEEFVTEMVLRKRVMLITNIGDGVRQGLTWQ